MGGTIFLDRLRDLSSEAFEILLDSLKVHASDLSARQSPQTQRATELLRLWGQRGDEESDWAQFSAALLQAEQLPTRSSDRNTIDGDLEQTKRLLEDHEYALAQKWLERIEAERWHDLPQGRQIRLLAQKGHSYFAQGDTTSAGQQLIKAAKIGPRDEKIRTDEAIGYELLGETSRAHELADNLIVEFPDSNRALALWLRTAPLDCSAEAQEPRLSDRQGAAASEVWLAVAVRALMQGDLPRAERLACRATEIDSKIPTNWLVLGQAIAWSSTNDQSRPTRLTEEVQDRLRQAAGYFEKASDLAKNEKRHSFQANVLVCLAQVTDLLGNTEKAEQFVREADRLMPNHCEILFCLGHFLLEKNRPEEAVQYLEQSLRLESRSRTIFFLALALNARKRQGDRDKATDLFAQAANIAEHEFSAQALQLAVEGFLSEHKLVEANSLLSKTSPSLASSTHHRTLMGMVALEAQNESGALADADSALRDWSAACHPVVTKALAKLLTRLERHTDALKLWLALFEPHSPGYETEALLYCARKIGRDDVLLDVCQKLREAKTASPNVQRLEFSLLERYDPAQAVEILQQYIDHNPNDHVARLALASCEVRIGRSNWSNISLDQLPSAKEIDPVLGAEVVRFFRENDRMADARDYAYQLVRYHYGNANAHRSLCLTFLSEQSTQLPTDSREQALPGYAISYVLDGEDNQRWVIIEDSPDPKLESVSHDTTQAEP